MLDGIKKTTADTALLKDSNATDVQLNSNQKTIDDFVDASTEKVTEEATPDPIAQKANETQENEKKRVADEEAERKEKENSDKINEKLAAKIEGALRNARDKSAPGREFLEALPSPGGIAAILFVLLFFVFAVIARV